MKRLLPALLLVCATGTLFAQSIPGPGDTAASAADAPAPKQAPTSAKASRAGNAAMQSEIEHLTHSNQELLDLLKQQQTVLEDIQYDRRLQNRQISLLEQRLEDTLTLNASLQAKVARLQAEAAAPRAEEKPAANSDAAPRAPESAVNLAPVPPPPPASYLPPEQSPGPPDTMWWHRLLSLSGEDSENSKTFHISGKQWRVLWHNQDRPGDAYKNTSALFINAFPAGDSIPKKVCSQLGSATDVTELTGTGDFYLKIEASGGHWEVAVEDFR
jgi:hypothetical protein